MTRLINHVLHFFIILLHLVFSFLHIKSLPITYTYIPIESISCILLLPFDLKATLLISSVKTLRLSLPNLCCVFAINLLFFINSLWFSLGLFVFSLFILLVGLFLFQVELLLNSFCNLYIYFFFCRTIFCVFCFFISIIIVC